MALKGGDPESVRDACSHLRDLAVAAEGPGAPFTATHRGQQLLRLIHVVVQNVGLEDKVGALTALRLLKADDTLLQKLLKEGVLPQLLRILTRDAQQETWEIRTSQDIDTAETFAETALHAARAIEAFSSSGDTLTTLLRGGAVEVLSERLTRQKGELADDTAAEAAVTSFPTDGNTGYTGAEIIRNCSRLDRIHKLRRQTAACCGVALSRVSGSNLRGIPESVAFGAEYELAVNLPPVPEAQTHAANSTARSLLCLLEGDAVVARKASAQGLARLAESGRAGRIASSKCGAVLPLMTAALAGNAGQRQAALDALGAIVRGSKDGRVVVGVASFGNGNGVASDANGARDTSTARDLHDSVDMSYDTHENEHDLGGDAEMDDNGGVRSVDGASAVAREAERAKLTAVNADANKKAGAAVTGTAGKVGELFFKKLIGVLTELLTLRGALERSAADASLALWALAWQPSNRRHMRDGEVVFPLIVLYREGSRLAADDAGAVLGVLARMDKDCASLINNVPIVGPSLLKHLTQKDSAERSESPNARERASQRRFTFANGGDGENGDGTNANVNGDSAASPNIRGTISGNHVAAAVARASPK